MKLKGKPRAYIGVLFLLLSTPMVLTSQFVKKWEIYVPTNKTRPSSYNINSSNQLKTIELSNGTLVTLGSRKKQTPNDGGEIVIFNFDKNGNILWEYVYPNTEDGIDYPNDIASDDENNIFIAAKAGIYYYFGEDDFDEPQTAASKHLLIKLNSYGELVWEKSIESKEEAYDFCKSVVVDSDSNLFTLSRIDSASVIHKYDNDGNEVWSKHINYVDPYSLEMHNDELICITNNDRHNKLSYIFFLNHKGEKIDSFATKNLIHHKPKFDSDGSSYNFKTTGDFGIEKWNRQGKVKWAYGKETNLPSNVFADELTDSTFDDEGNVYVTGRYYGEHYRDSLLYSNCDILTTKLDPMGNLIWENLYKHDNTPRSCQIAQVIKTTDEGKVFAAGNQSVEVDGDVFGSMDMVILQYGKEGQRVDSTYFNSIYDGEDYGVNLEIIDNELYLFGYSESSDGTYDMTVVKYVSLTSNTINPNKSDSVIAFPNPTDGTINLSGVSGKYDINIWSIDGELVFIKSNHDSKEHITLPRGLTDGMYLLQLKSERENHFIKVVHQGY